MLFQQTKVRRIFSCCRMSPLCYTAVVKICGISSDFISFAFILQKNMHPYTMKMILQEYMSSSWGHGRNAVGGGCIGNVCQSSSSQRVDENLRPFICISSGLVRRFFVSATQQCAGGIFSYAPAIQDKAGLCLHVRGFMYPVSIRRH